MSETTPLGNNLNGGSYINLPSFKASQNRVELKTNGISQLYIDSAGKVGIGTSNPNQLLHLYQPDSDEVQLKITNADTTNGILIGLTADEDFQIKQRDNKEILFFTNDNQQMCIGVSGAIGFGTSSPAENLHLHERSTGQSYIRFSNTETTNGVNLGLDSSEHFAIRHRDNKQVKIYTNDLQRLTVGSNGNVGIGTGSPNNLLELSVDDAAKPTTALWTISSDIRIKENIENADLIRCYTDIRSLPLRRYKWIDSYIEEKKINDKNVLGFIAQEVEEIIPKAVDTLPEANGLENFKTLNKDQILMSLVGCVKRIQEKLEQLVEDLNNSDNFNQLHDLLPPSFFTLE